jgi:hypothetical protein
VQGLVRPLGRLAGEPVEQDAVLDGDRRLVGQGAEQGGVVVAEPVHGLAPGLRDHQGADDRVVGAGDRGGQGGEAGEVGEPGRAGLDVDPARQARGHEHGQVGLVVGGGDLGARAPVVADDDAPRRLVLVVAEQQGGVVGPQQLAGGVEHRVGDLGQLGRAHDRRDEVEVGLQPAVALGQAAVHSVGGQAGDHDGGDQQAHVGMVPQRGGEPDADGGVEDGGDRTRAGDGEHGPPAGPALADHRHERRQRHGRGEVGGEQRGGQGERPLDRHGVGVAEHEPEHDDRRHRLTGVDRELVGDLDQPPVADHDDRRQHAHDPRGHERPGDGVDQPDGERDLGEREAVGLALVALDPQGEQLAGEEGDGEPQARDLQGRAGQRRHAGDEEREDDRRQCSQQEADGNYDGFTLARSIPRNRPSPSQRSPPTARCRTAATAVKTPGRLFPS